MPKTNQRTVLKLFLFVVEENREDRTVWATLKRIKISIPRLKREKH